MRSRNMFVLAMLLAGIPFARAQGETSAPGAAQSSLETTQASPGTRAREIVEPARPAETRAPSAIPTLEARLAGVSRSPLLNAQLGESQVAELVQSLSDLGASEAARTGATRDGRSLREAVLGELAKLPGLTRARRELLADSVVQSLLGTGASGAVPAAALDSRATDPLGLVAPGVAAVLAERTLAAAAQFASRQASGELSPTGNDAAELARFELGATLAGVEPGLSEIILDWAEQIIQSEALAPAALAASAASSSTADPAAAQ